MVATWLSSPFAYLDKSEYFTASESDMAIHPFSSLQLPDLSPVRLCCEGVEMRGIEAEFYSFSARYYLR